MFIHSILQMLCSLKMVGLSLSLCIRFALSITEPSATYQFEPTYTYILTGALARFCLLKYIFFKSYNNANFKFTNLFCFFSNSLMCFYSLHLIHIDWHRNVALIIKFQFCNDDSYYLFQTIYQGSLPYENISLICT